MLNRVFDIQLKIPYTCLLDKPICKRCIHLPNYKRL